MDYLPWLLQQIQQQSALEGRRLLDVFTSHYYPQGGEFSNDTSARCRRAATSPRGRCGTRPTSTTAGLRRSSGSSRSCATGSPSTIPGTAIGITEYNWGAEGHINGATTQADLYGIFGREGLDMAARWTTPDTASPTYKAMKIYRNYDGNTSTFGDVSVKTTSTSNPDSLSVFGAQRSGDNAVTVMVINKVAVGTPVTVNLSNFAPGRPRAGLPTDQRQRHHPPVGHHGPRLVGGADGARGRASRCWSCRPRAAR